MVKRLVQTHLHICFISEALLKFSVEWATNTKTYSAAVTVINLFHSLYDFQELLKIPSMASHIRDLLPYLGSIFSQKNFSICAGIEIASNIHLCLLQTDTTKG